MINLKINKDIIKISGHANAGDYGKDIVCASVSSIIYTTVNGIMNIDKNAIIFNDTEDVLRITIKKHIEVVDILIKNMIDLIGDLAKQYPQNIKIDKGE